VRPMVIVSSIFADFYVLPSDANGKCHFSLITDYYTQIHRIVSTYY